MSAGAWRPVVNVAEGQAEAGCVGEQIVQRPFERLGSLQHNGTIVSGNRDSANVADGRVDLHSRASRRAQFLYVSIGQGPLSVE
jgi:hypothetical protein